MLKSSAVRKTYSVVGSVVVVTILQWWIRGGEGAGYIQKIKGKFFSSIFFVMFQVDPEGIYIYIYNFLLERHSDGLPDLILYMMYYYYSSFPSFSLTGRIVVTFWTICSAFVHMSFFLFYFTF
jgi:hypothetical protein